jgi:hypothetical protein
MDVLCHVKRPHFGHALHSDGPQGIFATMVLKRHDALTFAILVETILRHIVGKIHATDDVTNLERCKMIRMLSGNSESDPILFCMSRAALSMYLPFS